MSNDETPEHETARPTTPAPGPTDHGGHGGMATREKAPELAAGDEPRDG